jgi:hypothetical protein
MGLIGWLLGKRSRSVWKRLRFLFDTDDGSLPVIRLTGLGPEGVARIFDFLRSRATIDLDVLFWHRILDREERLGAYPNPAQLVATGEADEFHVLARGLVFGGTTLPDLGVFVHPREVVLDYRMGPEWGEAEVLALFELLRQLTALDPGASVRLGEFDSPRVQRLFVDAWLEYCQQRPV